MSYTPSLESPADLWFERSSLAGGFLGCMAYGIQALLFSRCAHVLLKHRARTDNHRRWLFYVVALFSISTVHIGASLKYEEIIWIDSRNFPGGPPAFMREEYSLWINTLINAAYTINSFLTDGLLIYRVIIVWNYNYYVITFPILVFIATTIFSVLACVEAALPGNSLWSKVTVGFAIPYWSLSIVLNVMVTVLIIARILMVRRGFQATGGVAQGKYSSITAMLVESAALYSITSLVFIITYARNSNVQNIVLPILSQVMCIAPLLIIIRVAYGRAYDSHLPTSLHMTDMRFAEPEEGTSTLPTGTESMAAADDGIAVRRSLVASNSRSTISGWNSGSSKQDGLL
ncbi:hypothetical protein OE88DRAFT_1793238 [Heliocybe sulcata]|uniref:Uncharacterized protein n=1 Tax=Heliocybe sulcata TaxID=5364 RepID=A0A5C3N5Z2_9AGAM|nr:hypothetical protein OE88DRAFT_1793238 [Heliocybe sulcata]